MAYGYRRRYPRRSYRSKRKSFAKTKVGKRWKPKYKRAYSRKRKVYGGKLQTQKTPLTKIVKMRYAQTINVALVAATPSTYTFSANGIYKPNISGSGHQPSNHDYWEGLYGDYNVIGSKCTVKYVRTNVIQAETWFSVRPTEAVTVVPTTTNALLEFGKRPTMAGNWIDDNYNKARAYYSANKWYKRKVMSSAASWTAFGSNPNDQVYYQVNSVCETTNQTVTFLVEIEYTVALMKRIDNVSQSFETYP